MKPSNYDPGAILGLVSGIDDNPRTEEIEALFTGQIDAVRALAVIRAISQQPIYMAIFDDVLELVRDEPTSDSPHEVLSQMDTLYQARAKGKSELERVSGDETNPQWVRDEARASLARLLTVPNWLRDYLNPARGHHFSPGSLSPSGEYAGATPKKAEGRHGWIDSDVPVQILDERRSVLGEGAIRLAGDLFELDFANPVKEAWLLLTFERDAEPYRASDWIALTQRENVLTCDLSQLLATWKGKARRVVECSVHVQLLG